MNRLHEYEALLQQNQGVLTTTMGALRDAKGAGRLGVHIRKSISDELRGLGIGHYPSELPESHADAVRLYRLGSPVADLIDAVTQPSVQHDEELRVAAGGEDAKTLLRVRELVCR